MKPDRLLFFCGVASAKQSGKGSSPRLLLVAAALLLIGGAIFAFGWYSNQLKSVAPGDEKSVTVRVKPGMTIGEIGAGTGRVTVWLADAVGNKGMVYANDIDTKSLDHLKDRCKKEGLNNVLIIVGTVDNPKLPVASLDIAFMTNTYHHLDKPIDLVKKILPSLKENGYLVVVERDKERCPTIERDEATTIADFKKQMNEAGFEVIKVDTTMRVDNIYIARPKK